MLRVGLSAIPRDGDEHSLLAEDGEAQPLLPLLPSPQQVAAPGRGAAPVTDGSDATVSASALIGVRPRRKAAEPPRGSEPAHVEHEAPAARVAHKFLEHQPWSLPQSVQVVNLLPLM